MKTTLAQVREAKQEAIAQISPHANVVGVGITKVDGDYALKVNLSAPPANPARLPHHVNGVKVKTEVVGTIRKR